MKVDLKQAVKLFYSQSSFDQIYQEAVANALDAHARNISITFEASTVSDVCSFRLIVEDDGIGFTEERFRKFSRLMNVDEQDIKHRGLGRLVYLFYFDKVLVESFFENNKYRKFSFDEQLNDDAEDCAAQIVEDGFHSGSKLVFEGYNLSKLRSSEYVDPQWIKVRLLKKFIIQLFEINKKKEIFSIKINAIISGKVKKAEITEKSIPLLSIKDFPSSYSIDGMMKMYYSVKEAERASVITAMAIDGRTEPLDIFAEGNEPRGYEMFFILYSDSFQGKIDASRQKLEISPSDLKAIQSEFRKQIVEVLKNKIPNVIESYQKERKRLQMEFPHLEGYFEDNVVGIMSQNDVICEAQRRFMQEERHLFFKKATMSNVEYEKSLELAGRSLTQYITFRQYIIDKLKNVNDGDKEEIIHNLIVPQHQVIHAPNSYLNVYRNNIWIFDDKFMTFDVALSEKETTELLKQIDPDNTIKDIDRPDIAIIFSKDPKTASKVDVVIIELKKKGLKGGENLKVEYQLEQRARALYPFFKNKIQSLWLYGVTQMDDAYQATLNSIGYQPLYSKGTVYVNTNPITITMQPERIIVPAVRYIMDIDAVVNDADARNKTFIDLIRDRIRN